MKNVDLFVKYLSGELNQEEIASFEKERAKNPDFREEFELVSAAYTLIRDQLQERDEVDFRKRLLEVMEHPAKNIQSRGRPALKGWYVLVPLAASLAILLLIFLSPRNETLLFSRYYHPEKDGVVNTFMQGTRGRAESGILHYQQGNYMESRNIMQALVEEDPENLLARLFFLLASIETRQADEAIKNFTSMDPGLDHQLGQAVSWYSALAYLKMENKEEALGHLHALILHPGPYQTDAIRLKKKLLK
jgi:tetratricopeptide (TPR) repeat protein